MSDVIVIDDDAIFGELICEQLQSAQINAMFHHGWHKSSVVVQMKKPKLLLIDVNMPGMPGTLLIETIERLVDEMPKVILMSSMDIAEIEKLAKQFGANGALSKSSTEEEIVAMVRTTIAPATQVLTETPA